MFILCFKIVYSFTRCYKINHQDVITVSTGQTTVATVRKTFIN